MSEPVPASSSLVEDVPELGDGWKVLKRTCTREGGTVQVRLLPHLKCAIRGARRGGQQ